jgi:acyl-CoA synthetase (NDP forming)
LNSYGIVVPQSREVATVDEAVAAAEAIGFPVALKIRSPDILHKTESGGVALHLGTADMVRSAATNLLASAATAFPQARLDGFLVQEMVSGVEMIAGARVDPLYGPLLVVGAGGILVELVNDVALRLLPVSAADVRAMIDSLKASKLLAGFRGQPAADRAALEEAVSAIGTFFLDHREDIKDIEINPLMIRSDGRGAVAVDVRVIWQRERNE